MKPLFYFDTLNPEYYNSFSSSIPISNNQGYSNKNFELCTQGNTAMLLHWLTDIFFPKDILFKSVLFFRQIHALDKIWAFPIFLESCIIQLFNKLHSVNIGQTGTPSRFIVLLSAGFVS